MLVKKLLQSLNYEVIQGTDEIEVKHLIYDSRKVAQGDVFVCLKGAVSDGHTYIQQVIEKQAAVIIVENQENKEIYENTSVTVIQVKDTRMALSYMSAEYFDHPAKKLKMIGITGTKGKTTTTYMVREMLTKAGIQTGLIGTIEVIIDDDIHIKSVNTTPESYVLQEYLTKMIEAGCKCVVMEVSSQGLKYHRVTGIEFDYGIFNNLEADHIGPDEHDSFEDYLESKAKLFKQCKVGIINVDDRHAMEIIKDHTCKIETFGFSNEADLCASDMNLTMEDGKLGVEFQISGLLNMKVKSSIPGRFSVYNSLTSIAICRHFQISEQVIKDALLQVQVKGRVERVPVGNRKFTVMIDYAHNSMSLSSLLTTIKEYEPKRLITVFGCGGNRAKQRRYDMGEISSRLADLSVITSDNPRFEEPQDIIDDILVGIKKHEGKYVTILDRKEAIRYCLMNAKENDVILLVGKGHESYQEIKGVKHDFDERKVVAEVLKEMDAKGL